MDRGPSSIFLNPSKRTRNLAFYPRFAIDLSSSASVPSLPAVRHPSQDGRREGEEGKKRPHSRPLTSFVTLISGSFVSGCVNERSRVLSEEALGPRCSRGENKRNKGMGARGRRRAGSRDNRSYTLVACHRAGWKFAAPADEEEVVARHQTPISSRFSSVS